MRKEAVLKALRVGLRTDPALVDVRGDVVHVGAPGSLSVRAQVRDLQLGPGLSGAVAVSSSDVAVGAGEGGLVVVQHDGADLLATLAGR